MSDDARRRTMTPTELADQIERRLSGETLKYFHGLRRVGGDVSAVRIALHQAQLSNLERTEEQS